jgi:hypothetical protein
MNTDGGPFDWPLITCGYPYVMVMDLQHGDPKLQQVAVSLLSRGL